LENRFLPRAQDDGQDAQDYHAGRKALTLYSVPPATDAADIPMLARLYGFSLHAASQKGPLVAESVPFETT